MADSIQNPSPEALFRFLIVSAVRALELQGYRRSDAVRDVAARAHPLGMVLKRVSERTIWRWLPAYEQDGLASLQRAPRQRVADSTVLPEDFLDYLRDERKKDRDASIPELIRRARLAGALHPRAAIDRTTVWRAMRRMGLETRRRKVPKEQDTRRFAYTERMQMLLADFKHFRAGADRYKRVALYLIDDATRYALLVKVATSEQAEVLLLAWAAILRQFGLMDAIYWDNGSAFKANDVIEVAGQLDVAAIRGTPGYAQGHGKIERFNQSLKARIVRSLDRAEHVDPDLGALDLLLDHDRELYNHLPHESLDGDTPHARFVGSQRPLRPIESEDWLADKFTISIKRRVSNDHVVRHGGKHWEVPRGHVGEKIRVYRRLLEADALYVAHSDRLVRLHLVDLAFNATSGRAKPPTAQSQPEQAPAKSASVLDFERTYASMLGPDGGFDDD